jgi:hypothetical protein
MPISQKPKQLFNLDIDDDILRQNFESLNRELQRLQGVQAAQPTNIRWSQGEFGVYGGTSGGIFRPPGLNVSITTRGNPVELELAPSPVLNVGTSFLMDGVTSGAGYRPPAGDILFFYYGIYRKSGGREVMLFKQLNLTKGAGILNGEGTVNFSRYIDTTAPAGLHQYQFFVEIRGMAPAFPEITFYNQSLFAKEA